MKDVLKRYRDLVPKIKSLVDRGSSDIKLTRYRGLLFVKGKMMNPKEEQFLEYLKESNVDLDKFEKHLGKAGAMHCFVDGSNVELHHVDRVILAVAESL